MPTQETLTIQEMARQSGLSEHTLRYYERIGLLPPIPRENSSGHRRYSADMISVVESLSCLRGTGMPLEDIRTFLHLCRQGNLAAGEQKALFAAHLAVITDEMEQIKFRREFLAAKVAYWSAVEAGNMEAATVARNAARRLIPMLTGKKGRQ